MTRSFLQLLVVISFGFPAYGGDGGSYDCQASGNVLHARISGRSTYRHRPELLIGFNVPWFDFQKVFAKGGTVDAELVRLMRPFRGAVYRYPGGSPSNSFIFEQSIGDPAKRPKMLSDYNQYSVPFFGLDEFYYFVRQVDGYPLITANIFGDGKNVWSLPEVERQGEVLARLLKQRKCGRDCDDVWIEIGNELDRKPHGLLAAEYGLRAKYFMKGFERLAPRPKWILMGYSAPWDTETRTVKEYNDEVLSCCGEGDSLAIHSYYDGINVEASLGWVDYYKSSIGRSNKSAYGYIWVTEHGRWPNHVQGKDWRSQWYKTTNMDGSISTVDYILGLLPRGFAFGAVWHALSGAGPWQLIRKESEGKLVPSALYWSLRFVLDHLKSIAEEVVIDGVGAVQYKGGYNQRVVFVREGPKCGFIGVNRSASAVMLALPNEDEMRERGCKVTEVLNLPVQNSKDNYKVDVEYLEDDGYLNVNRRGYESNSSIVCLPASSIFSIDYK